MALPQRSDLRTYARLLADQDSSDFPTDTQYNLYLDKGARKVWWDLRVAGWPVNFASTVITATGATQYALSGGSPSVTTQVASIHGVYFLQGSDFYPLHRINEGKRAALMSSTFQPSGYAGWYDYRVDPTTGPTVEILPKPTAGTYRVDYISEFPGFASDSDTWYGPAGSDVLVSCWAAYLAVRKEGPARLPEAQALLADYKDELAEVVNRASWADMRNPAQIRDVNSEFNRYSFDYPLAGPDPAGYY